jgi:hypothetical protein
VRLRGVLRKPNERRENKMPKVWATVGWIESSGVLMNKSLPVKTRVLLYLIRWGDRDCESYHSKSKIGNAVGASRTHVQNELKDLEDAGIIERHPDRRNGTVRLKNTSSTSHRSGDTHSHSSGDTKKTTKKAESISQRLRRLDTENSTAYGAEWKEYVFCRKCMRADVPLRQLGKKWNGQLRKKLPIYECVYPNDCNG